MPKEFIVRDRSGYSGSRQERYPGRLRSGGFQGDAVIDGSYHDVDSSEMAFKIAGSMAFKEAMAKADPALMEPMMKLEIIVPERVPGRCDRRSDRPPRTRFRAWSHRNAEQVHRTA